MITFVTAGAGFLFAVLWFDLMHDVQVRGHEPGQPLPADVVDSIAGYYGRVTTGARPMNLLVAAVMLATILALVIEAASGDVAAVVVWPSLALTLLSVGTAARRTVRTAQRLGTRTDEPVEFHRLARTVHRDHLLCAAGIGITLALHLLAAV